MELIERDFGDSLRDSLPSIQFKERKKLPWRSFTFSKVAGGSRICPTQKSLIVLRQCRTSK